MPHRCWSWTFSTGRNLQRIRRERLGRAGGRELAGDPASDRVVPLRVSGTDAPVIEALAAERAAAQLASLGFRVEVLEVG